MKYQHKVQYYETDKMAIVHHSNYVRWMEEARVFFLEQVGAPFEKIEEMGILCPVLEVSCKYLNMVRFGETVTIDVRLSEFSGVKMYVVYDMYKADGTLCCTAESRHCFMKDGKVLNLKRKYPEVYQKFFEDPENFVVK